MILGRLPYSTPILVLRFSVTVAFGISWLFYGIRLLHLEERRREMTTQELGAILSGIDLEQAKRRKRYQRSA